MLRHLVTLSAAATAGVLVAAITFTASPTTTTDGEPDATVRPPVTEPAPPTTPADAHVREEIAPEPDDPGTVLLIGDSLMSQTLGPLSRPANRQSNAPVFVVDAEGGSGLYELGHWLDRLGVLVAAVAPDAVVISFGTNSAPNPDVVGDYDRRAGQLLDVIGDVPVAWYAPRTDYGFGTVEIGLRLAAVARERPNLDVRPMDTLLDGHPERSADDGIHLSWWGELAFAQDMLRWLTAHGLGDGDHALA